MNLLAIDTSSKNLSVAASHTKEWMAEANLTGALRHSEHLFDLVHTCLRSVGVELAGLDALACGLGPGSFTGLRIGLAAMKGLVIATGKPCYGVSSLDLIARNVAHPSGHLAVLVNARRERIYAAFYSVAHQDLRRESEDLLLTLEELISKLRFLGSVSVAGDAVIEYGAKLKEALPQVELLSEEVWYPRARHLAKWIGNRYKDMERLGLKDLKPRYLRVSEAEEKFLLKKNG